MVERGQPEVETVGQAGPGFLALAGSCHIQHDFLGNGDHHVDHHPVVVRRVAHLACAVEFGCLRVVNQMSHLTVGSLENTSRLVDVSLNWTINSTG